MAKIADGNGFYDTGDGVVRWVVAGDVVADNDPAVGQCPSVFVPDPA
jgi:hypothetical protein